MAESVNQMLFYQILLYASLIIILILTVILIVNVIRIRNINYELSEARKLILSIMDYIKKKSLLLYPDKEDLRADLDISDMNKVMSYFRDSIKQELKLVDSILDSIMQGVLIINSDRRIVRINENLLNLFYLKKEEVLFKKTAFIFKNRKFEGLIDNVFNEVVPHGKNIMFYGDEEKYLQVEAIPITLDKERNKVIKDKEVGLLVLFKNITQEVEFSKLRSQFVANISHEMRTPLTSIKGYLETIVEDKSINQNRIKDYLSRSLKEVERLNYLIKDVLNVSNIEYKRNVLFEREYNLVDIIKDTVKSLIFLAEKNDIKIDFKYSNDQINYQTDEELFRQMVRNIIENSIFYAGKGTEINIDIKEDENNILLAFRDNGAGMEKDELPYIFQRFYRGKNLKSLKQIGSGLGLSIVKHTVGLHNGKISVNSIPNKETVFNIILPKKSAKILDL
ncbi:MAG: ATP-binding protein [Actinomycetia bacterium]|nr:ATP-binding protein [Actinomycetes bacterium]